MIYISQGIMMQKLSFILARNDIDDDDDDDDD